MRQRVVELNSVVAVRPTDDKSIVTSFSANNGIHGKLFKIRECKEDRCILRCVLRPFGGRTGRGEQNFPEFTCNLVETFPLLR